MRLTKTQIHYWVTPQLCAGLSTWVLLTAFNWMSHGTQDRPS